MEKGWVGAAKGVHQILWERGWLDSGVSHTVDGQKDRDRKVTKEMSLRHLMSKQPDFKNKQTAIQQFGEKIGLEICQTPKFCAELAGEGTEHDWASSKNDFKHSPLTGRTTMKGFRGQAAKSMATVTLAWPRGAARRARSCIVARDWLKKNNENVEALNSLNSKVVDAKAV